VEQAAIPTESDIRLAGQRLIEAYGTEAWFVAADLAVAAARAGNSTAAELCNRIALAIEELGSPRLHRLQ
jgi:hypothetical protein